MKRVYICSPCRGDYERNLMRARGYCRDALECGVLPIAPHVYFTQFLNDDDATQRDLGMTAGLDLLEVCDEIWVFVGSGLSEGMRAEIAMAENLGITVVVKE